jgi:c-di-GMP-binding flagellar brake protein YcgR
MEDIEQSFVKRRDWPRTAIEKLIEEALLALPAQGSESAPRAEVVNLSEAGAGVLIPTRLEKGTKVRLEISVKDLPGLDFEAEVRWAATSPVSTGKFPAGLKFMNLDEQLLQKLQGFIQMMRQHRPPPA